MTGSKYLRRAATAAAMVITAMTASPVIASPPSGLTTTNFVTADLDPADHINSDRIKFQTKGPTDIRMQKLEFAAGGATGWHHHPGMVIVAVASGTIEVWDTSCGKTAYGPGSPNGSVFIEALPHAHQATSTNGATIYVTYVVPNASPPTFRVEEQVPFCAQN